MLHRPARRVKGILLSWTRSVQHPVRCRIGQEIKVKDGLEELLIFFLSAAGGVVCENCLNGLARVVEGIFLRCGTVHHPSWCRLGCRSKIRIG